MDLEGVINVQGFTNYKLGHYRIFGLEIFSGAGGVSIISQIIGILVVLLFAGIFALTVFGGLKLLVGIRVSEEVEKRGLDSQFGIEMYPEHVIK